MGAMSRRKGAAGEREVVHELERLLPGHPWRRSAPMQAGHARDGDGDVDGHPRLHVEVKRSRAVRIPAALKQAIADAAVRGRMPLVISRENRGEWIASLRLEDLAAIIREADADRGER